jgi:hypothetical protein
MNALDALRELVAVRQLRAEVTRRKGRRLYYIERNPAEVRAVNKLHHECLEREFRAWNVAVWLASSSVNESVTNGQPNEPLRAQLDQ